MQFEWQRPLVKFEKLKKYTVAPCLSNHSHISCKWYVLTFGQWLFKCFSAPLIRCTNNFSKMLLFQYKYRCGGLRFGRSQIWLKAYLACACRCSSALICSDIALVTYIIPRPSVLKMLTAHAFLFKTCE